MRHPGPVTQPDFPADTSSATLGPGPMEDAIGDDNRESEPRNTRTLKRLIGRLCLIAGAMWLAWQALSLAGEVFERSLEDRTQVAALPSPDNDYVAIVMVTVGSAGAMSTWCEVAVYVKPAAAGAPSRGDGDRAYNGGCDFAIGSRPENIKWTSPRNLEVSFDPEISGTAQLTTRMSNRPVTVTYAFRKGQSPF